MRFFRYPFYDKIIKSERKTRFKNLDEKAKKNVRINKLIGIFLFVLYLMLVCSLIILIRYLLIIIENSILEVIMMVGMILVTIVVPILIILLIFHFIKIPSVTIGELTLQNIQSISIPLKEFYKVSQPMIVTKCYNSSDKSFNNKDVIVFLYKWKKIRIVLDFNHTMKDFGCYEFQLSEIECHSIKEGNLLKTVIVSNDTEFVLGQRAKSFIKKVNENVEYLDKLDVMIAKLNSFSYKKEFLEEWDYFKKTYTYILDLISKKIILSDPKKKSIDYLMSIIENDGPEYCYTIDFCSSLDSNRNYRIGVCVRGEPLLKKL